MINTSYEQELLNCEILLNNFEIKYKRIGHIFILSGCKLMYCGPQLNWKVREQYFKLKGLKCMYIMHSLKVYCDGYERFLLLSNIPDLLYDMVHYEIMPKYLLL